MFNTDRIWETMLAIIIALTGGLARLLRTRDIRKLRWFYILSEIFISGFAGVMTLFLGRALNLTGDWLGLVCGMAGWLGPKVLDSIAKVAFSKTGLDINSDDDKDKKRKK